MTQDELLFLGTHMEALPLYETFREAVLAAVSGTKIRVEKAQITFAERRGFAFLSLHPARRSGERPPVWMTVSFGLGYRKASPPHRRRCGALSRALDPPCAYGQPGGDRRGASTLPE